VTKFYRTRIAEAGDPGLNLASPRGLVTNPFLSATLLFKLRQTGDGQHDEMKRSDFTCGFFSAQQKLKKMEYRSIVFVGERIDPA
jgi:hypothetical protein